TSAHPAHTAHVGLVARIKYRHHPLFGRQVRIARRCPNDSPDSVVVLLPNGTSCTLPRWMLDPAACATLLDAPHPFIALDALISPRNLLDAPPLPSAAVIVPLPTAPPPEGTTHAASPHLSADSAPAAQAPAGSTPQTATRPVPGPARPAPARGRTRR